ncbi:Scr1 family TA system antitoxin-like transcriptional regulator [Streptomyces sp. TRM68367]|uniref:helix-turn-helix domain-containing protein n=1 Tax=Streptomyces sp. TRM68367 TaxID=2758415 RepID=UPI00165B9247|nr:Scr1 family TA system antitoxin-like transcriptional regulator [Streptomyces sp. TRM68367]MBC9724523.1 helix-turn-helix domain-containing protein [Streptomyces sp. TRM68367]
MSVTARPPTVRLRRLASELKRARKAAGLSQGDVTAQTRISPATLYRIEKPEGRPQMRTLLTLLDLYGVGADVRSRVMALHEGADTQGWLRPYRDALRDEYNAYIQFEAEAMVVRNWEALYIPGLLQTEPYAHAVIKGHLPNATPEDLEQRVKARMDRQEVLTKKDPLELTVIMDEAALHRQVGGPHVMAEQLQRLEATVDLPHVSLHVIPWDVGAHPGMPGSFVVLSFADPDDGQIVYIDSMANDSFLESPADIDRYGGIFDDLRRRALSPDDSVALIAKTRRECTRELETA